MLDERPRSDQLLPGLLSGPERRQSRIVCGKKLPEVNANRGLQTLGRPLELRDCLTGQAALKANLAHFTPIPYSYP